MAKIDADRILHASADDIPVYCVGNDNYIKVDDLIDFIENLIDESECE